MDIWDKICRRIDRALWLDNYSVRLYDKLLKDCRRSKCKPYEIADVLEKLGKEYREYADVGAELADVFKALKEVIVPSNEGGDADELLWQIQNSVR